LRAPVGQRLAEYHGPIDGALPGSDPAEELDYVL